MSIKVLLVLLSVRKRTCIKVFIEQILCTQIEYYFLIEFLVFYSFSVSPAYCVHPSFPLNLRFFFCSSISYFASARHSFQCSCMATKLVWKRVLRLLHEVYGSSVYKWRTMMWVDIKSEVQNYEKEKVNFALYTRGQYVEEVSPCMCTNLVQNGVVWETISSRTLWVLWTSRCRRIFLANSMECCGCRQGDWGGLGAYTKRRI